MSAAASESTSRRVYICDARPFDRAALNILLENEHVPVARITGDVSELVDDVAARPDPVVLIGTPIVREHGTDAVDALHAANPRAVVILVGVDDATLPARARNAHADGYLLRDGNLAARLRQALTI